MCLNPIAIPNKSRMYKGKVDSLAFLHDTKSQYIYVPCGHCPQCLRSKQVYLIQRCQLESMDNYLYFCTLTYRNELLPNVDINGFIHYYSELSDIQNLFKRLRKSSFFQRFTNGNTCSIKYLYVTEYGSKNHRPHFHVIFFVPKSLNDFTYTPLNYEAELFKLVKDNWCVNWSSSSKYPNYIPLCDFHTRFVRGNLVRNFDLHYVNPSLTSGQDSDVAFYVTKYCLKFDKWFDNKRIALYKNLPVDDYLKFYNLLRPRLVTSKFFGCSASAKDYIRKCIDDFSKHSLYPLFRNPIDGKLFPMSKYLFDKFGTIDDKVNFFYRSQNPDSYEDSFHYTKEFDYQDVKLKEEKFLKNNLRLSEKFA